MLVLKALVPLIERVDISATRIFVTLIFTIRFHTKMTTIADAMTGQKTIRNLRSRYVEKTRRDEQFS